MDRKLLLVFALTFLVMMLFQPLMKKYGPGTNIMQMLVGHLDRMSQLRM